MAAVSAGWFNKYIGLRSGGTVRILAVGMRRVREAERNAPMFRRHVVRCASLHAPYGVMPCGASISARSSMGRPMTLDWLP